MCVRFGQHETAKQFYFNAVNRPAGIELSVIYFKTLDINKFRLTRLKLIIGLENFKGVLARV